MALSTALVGGGREARAAVYGPRSWFLSGSVSFDVLNAEEINEKTNNIAPLPGLLGARLKVERGLVSPAWSHWVEFDYFKGSATAVDASDGNLSTYTHSLSYMTIIPVGITYWLGRTAFLDFGISAGAGLALAPSYDFSTKSVSGETTEESYVGQSGLAFAARVDGRFWLSQYVGATFSVGVHYFASELTSEGQDPIQGNLIGTSVIGGLTYAFGGVKGTGRSFVDVIKDKPDVRPKAPPRGAPVTAPPKGSRR